MNLQLGFLLLSIVFVAGRELTINNYVINIENDTLISVRPLRRSSIELNLSRLGLRNIAIDAFNDNIDAIILNLGHNYLTKLPESIFSKLTKIEHILLMDNQISHFVNAFIGLSNLQSLNISSNPIESLLPGEFYGLSTSVNIFLSGTLFDKMSASVFERNKLKFEESPKSKFVKRSSMPENLVLYGNVCIHRNRVLYLENLKETDYIPSICKKIPLGYSKIRKVELMNMNITGFVGLWYRLKLPSDVKVKIMLQNNNIEYIDQELTIDLPSNVIFVNLKNNRIKYLYHGGIQNHYLRGLDLSNNLIQKIHYGALHYTTITELILDNNYLDNIDFVETLPASIQKLQLMNNNIYNLPANSFINNRKLSHLDLSGNNITILRKDSLRGLSSLNDLRLSENHIKKIEEGSFNDLENLKFLQLRGNHIESINKNLFDGPKQLVHLDLGSNKLTKLMTDSVPKGLLSFMVDYNEINYLEQSCFADLPLVQLSLEGNKINNILKGTFNSANQRFIKEPDLENIRIGLHYLADNLINERSNWFHKIFLIPFKSLSSVDLTGNPINRLMNGAFFGIPKDETKWIFFAKGQIDHIQGGLFDDV